jgi:predicted RND superfamily exporter protein
LAWDISSNRMRLRLVTIVLAAALPVFGMLLMMAIQQISFNNDHWLPKTNPYQRDLDYLNAEFQPGFSSLVVLRFPDTFFTEDNTAFFRSFKADIEALPYVTTINSPLDATVIISTQNTVAIETYDDALASGNLGSLSEFQERFRASPYAGKLLSNDHRLVGLSVTIDKKNDENDLERRVSVIQQIQGLLKALPQHIQGFVSGDAAIYYEMDRATEANLIRFVPMVCVFLFVITWFFLKNIRAVAIVMLPTLINLGIVPIVIVLLGHTITIINMTLFILVLVITVADAIHLLHYWERYTIEGSDDPIGDTLRATWLPCLITSATTAVGFGSFATSTITPLNQYGYQAFTVMVLAFGVVMVVVPVLLYLIPPPCSTKESVQFFPRGVLWIGHLVRRHSPKVVVGSLLMAALMGIALTQITTDTSFISVFFKPTHPVRQQVATIDRELTGSGRLDVLIRSNEPNTFKDISVITNLKAMVQEALAFPLIEAANDITVPVGMIHRAFQTDPSSFPQSNAALEQELLFLEFSRGDAKTDVMSSVVDFDYSNARIELITDQLPSSQIDTIVTVLKRVFVLDAGFEIAVTGSQFLSYVLGKYVLVSQALTIAITFVFIWVIFIGVFGFKLGSIGMIPNIVPMVITLGFLPVTNTPFDFATVLISSVTMGLCVDDTIHWLNGFTIACKEGRNTPAIYTTRMMIKPLFLTSIILGLGFVTLGMADLVILQRFGFATFVAIALAFVSDIILLPALIRWVFVRK